MTTNQKTDQTTNSNSLRTEDMSRGREIFFHFRRILLFIWLGAVIGCVVGGISLFFSKLLTIVTETREEHDFIIWFLPVAGVIIVLFYKLMKNENDKGTNLVISSISEGHDVPLKMSPLIVFGTTMTHFFGGSAGREGAALQLGGSLGNFLGKVLRLDALDRKITIMCGMSAAFSALFGTPMAAAIFPMECISVGIMHYSALLPCVISSLTASTFAANMGISPESFPLDALHIPEFGIGNALWMVLLGALCGLVSIAFCLSLKYSKKYIAKWLPNIFVRVIVVAVFFVVVTKLIGGNDFYGAGIGIIDKAVIEGDTQWYTFILKMFFTSIILAAGFKGGEIVPTFAIGATFGCLFGKIVGLPPQLCAAMGMASVFCGVTNSPISTILIGFELFGFDCVPYLLVAVSVSYVFSGYYGIYGDQKIIYSKYRTVFKNRKVSKK